MTVPFLDLKIQYQSIKDEIHQAINGVIETTSFAGGKYVSLFEEQFASYCSTDYTVACGSGTDALLLALRALDIGVGDEVITVPNTFIATVEAICLCGASPVFVDVNNDDFTMDPTLLEAVISIKTKAIIPVHLYGQMADMDPIIAIAKRHNIPVIEDACQSHGAIYKDRKAGSIGEIGCFSFYPGKNLGAYGEAGAAVTSNKLLCEKMNMLRDHGQSRKYYHDVIGWNSRMDGMQGAILSVKLEYIDQWNRCRIQNAAYYSHALKNNKSLKLPYCRPENKHVYHIFPLLVKERDALLEKMKSVGVSCGVHYPVPVHLQKALKLGKDTGEYPHAENCADNEISLPMFPELNEKQMGYVIESLQTFTEYP